MNPSFTFLRPSPVLLIALVSVACAPTNDSDD